MSSLLQKPEKSGKPASDRAPHRKVTCVCGMIRRSPPMRRMSMTLPIACITEPDVQRELGRLADAAREQEQAAERHRPGVPGRERRRPLEQLGEVQRVAEVHPQQKDAEDQPGVAEAR